MFTEISNASTCNFSPGALERPVIFASKLLRLQRLIFAAHIQANSVLSSKIQLLHYNQF
jgi:hypothetical protein